VRAVRRYIKPRPLTIFGEPIQWVDTTRYLAVSQHTDSSGWFTSIRSRKKTAQGMGMLGPLLNRWSDLSIRNGVLFYKQLISRMMDYACPPWRFTACTYVWKLHVLQSKFLRFATGAPLYICGRQNCKDLGVPLFVFHIRALTVSFSSKLAKWGTPEFGNSVDTYLSPDTKMPGYIMQSWGTSRIPLPTSMTASPLCLPTNAYLQFAMPFWTQYPDS
jgi:hypothetical protein